MVVKHDEFHDFLDNLSFSAATDDESLGYQDPFVTEQQMDRDKLVTELLAEYVRFYEKKVKHSTVCRYVILIPCVLIICVFSVMLLFFAAQMLGPSQSGVQGSDLAAFITACVSFISLIIGLLTVITKYFFPENDEQYITTIVEAIQKNDLENKRENAKNTPAGSSDKETPS